MVSVGLGTMVVALGLVVLGPVVLGPVVARLGPMPGRGAGRGRGQPGPGRDVHRLAWFPGLQVEHHLVGRVAGEVGLIGNQQLAAQEGDAGWRVERDRRVVDPVYCCPNRASSWPVELSSTTWFEEPTRAT
jgi:hypothetical protein